jgi:hypothetical protein
VSYDFHETSTSIGLVVIVSVTAVSWFYQHWDIFNQSNDFKSMIDTLLDPRARDLALGPSIKQLESKASRAIHSPPNPLKARSSINLFNPQNAATRSRLFENLLG